MISNKPRIALIIPYFGKFPEWMELYLYTCSRNPQIDFHYYTDCKIPDKIYPNTIFHEITFTEYYSLINNTLNISFGSVSHNKAFKLCDIRPFLCLLHPQILSEYEWWGWGDIDVIYGDLSQLINTKNLSRYNLITTHIKCTAGHFTILKSTSKFSNICMKIHNWKKLLENPNPMWVDEVAFSELIRPTKTRLIDKVWYTIGSKLKLDRTKFYRALEKILPGKSEILMAEPYTTFKPIPNATYKYNLSSQEFYIPGALDVPELKAGWYKLPYLHLLYFKKVFYYDTECFWRPGFYKLPKDADWDNINEIELNTRHITLSSEK